MTQIISAVTREAVFVVSDRRLTWGSGPRFGEIFDDDTCKLVSVCSTCAVAYTGLAHLGRPPIPTHHWIANLFALNNCNSGSVGARLLIQAASEAFVPLPFAPPHSFLIAGWGRFDSGVHPYLCRVTNTVGDDGTPLGKPSRKFLGLVRPLGDGSPFDLLVLGRQLRSAEREKVLRRTLKRLVERGVSAKTVLQLLVDEVIYSSRADGLVGRKVLAAVIPFGSTNREPGNIGAMIVASQPSDDAPAFSYFELGYEGPIQYGPTYTCDGWAVTDTQVTIDGNDQSMEARILRENPNKPFFLAVRAGPNQGYFLDLSSKRFFKLVNGLFEELKSR